MEWLENPVTCLRVSGSACISRELAVGGCIDGLVGNRQSVRMGQEKIGMVLRIVVEAENGLLPVQMRGRSIGCSSAPSAEISVKPTGATRRTWPVKGVSPPHCSYDGHAGVDLHRVGGQDIGFDFQRTGIADLQKRLTTRYNALAFVLELETPAADAGTYLNKARGI